MAKGRRSNPLASGRVRDKSGLPGPRRANSGMPNPGLPESGLSNRAWGLVVEISTSTLPWTPALSVSVLGLKRQSASVGSVPQAKVNVPLAPEGVMTSV